MRSASFAVIVLCSCLVATALGQQAQRARIKKVDAEKGLVTLTTADGADVECTVTPQTIIHDVNNQDIADFRQKGLPAGTAVMFRGEQRDGKFVLVGLKVAPQNAAQKKGDGKAGGQAKTDGKAGKGFNVAPPPPPRESIGVKPLTELGSETYKGESGGLY